jgi:hypothetical protein
MSKRASRASCSALRRCLLDDVRGPTMCDATCEEILGVKDGIIETHGGELR